MGSSLCAFEEPNVVVNGFALQGVSKFAECARAVVAEIVLSGSEFKLDPLSYTFFMAPVCLVVLAIGNIITWDHSVITDLAIWRPYPIPNVCMAFPFNGRSWRESRWSARNCVRARSAPRACRR